MLQWGAASLRIEHNKPKPAPGDWEGEAADAAYARMTTFGNWLTALSEAWHDLAEAASKIISAHDKAKSAHDPIAKEYTELEARMRELAGVTGPHGGVRVQREMEKIRKRMEELQAQSDQVRQEYASGATFTPVRPADPPFKPAGGLTFTGSSGAGGGAGDHPTGDPAAMTQKMGESMGGPQPQSGSRAGWRRRERVTIGRWIALGRRRWRRRPSGTPGGGTPSGSPKLPTDPSLRPAAGGGGSGGGAGGGSGGSAPLSPAVTAETVAPGPPMPVGAGSAPGTGAAGGMAGGMGGMAPMHGAQGAQQGKEKRRDPLTAPDEDLYIEDRRVDRGGHRQSAPQGCPRRQARQSRKTSDRRDASGGRRRPAAGAAVAVTDG